MPPRFAPFMGVVLFTVLLMSVTAEAQCPS